MSDCCNLQATAELPHPGKPLRSHRVSGIRYLRRFFFLELFLHLADRGGALNGVCKVAAENPHDTLRRSETRSDRTPGKVSLGFNMNF